MSMRQNGLVKGGTEACAIIGYGNRWYEPGQVRFMDDEPVRHKMLDLIVSSSKPHILLLIDLADTLDNVKTGCTRHVCQQHDVNLSVTSMRCIVPCKMLQADLQSAVVPAVLCAGNGIMSCLYFVCFAEPVFVRQLKSRHGMRLFMLSSCSFQLHNGAILDARWACKSRCAR